MTAAEKIIESLRFTCTEAQEQKGLFTPSHTLFKCVVVNPANCRRFTFSYQCNTDYHQPEKKACLSCLFMDASSYECAAGVDDFLKEFGYDDSLENIRKGEKAFRACKRTAAAINRLFTTEEKATLDEFFQEY